MQKLCALSDSQQTIGDKLLRVRQRPSTVIDLSEFSTSHHFSLRIRASFVSELIN